MKNILHILGWKTKPIKRSPEQLAKAKASVEAVAKQLRDAMKERLINIALNGKF